MKTSPPADAAKTAKKAAKSLDGKKGHLVLLIDESGSMTPLREAVIMGVNEYLNAFRQLDGNENLRVSLVFFDSYAGTPVARRTIARKRIEKVDDLPYEAYRPRGGTPLNDAILDTIGFAAKAQAKDEMVNMVIITDGHENASEARRETVMEEIQKRDLDPRWTFLFLGANIDAQTVAAGYGMAKMGQSMNFAHTKTGTSSSLLYAANDSSSNLISGKVGTEEVRASTARSTGSNIPEEEDE